MMRSALAPLFFRVAATAELPARESFALGAHEFAHDAAASRTFGSDDYEAPATSTKRLTTTSTHRQSFKMVNPTARAILDMGGSADGWI